MPNSSYTPPQISRLNVTTLQRNAISTPTTGQEVFNTSQNSIDEYNGSAWISTYPHSIITSSATLLTIDKSFTCYIKTGTLLATWTLPSVGSFPGRTITLANKSGGTGGAITINTNIGGSDLWTLGISSNTMTILRGEVYNLYDDGTNYIVTN